MKKNDRRQDDLWRAHALRVLPVLLDATDMLICGEDLGFVPACLPPVMQVGPPAPGARGLAPGACPRCVS